MTKVVKCAGAPDRYACDRCGCEIGAGPDPSIYTSPVGVGGYSARVIREGEPPLAFDPECDCDCHAAWRMVYKSGNYVPDEPW